MVRTGPSMFRRIERSMVAAGIALVVLLLERLVLRSARTTQTDRR